MTGIRPRRLHSTSIIHDASLIRPRVSSGLKYATCSPATTPGPGITVCAMVFSVRAQSMIPPRVS
jgi:hypothetical protein